MYRIPPTVCLVTLLCFVSPCRAQAPAGTEAKVNQAVLDLSVPESPAFTALDLTPESVTRPSTPRDLASALLSGVDKNGNLQTGVAIDAAPFPLFLGANYTLDDYNRNELIPILWRTQLSIATAKGTSDDDEATRLATGVRFTPWDRGDPRLDDAFVACIKNALAGVDLEAIKELKRAKVRERNKLQDSGQDTAAIDAEIALLDQQLNAALNKAVEAPFDECNRNPEFQSNLWNASSWTLGAVPYWTSEDGAIDELGDTGVSLWTSVAYGFDGFPDAFRRRAQLIAHGRYMINQMVPDQTNSGNLDEQDMALIGGRLRVGWSRFNVNLEGAWVHEDPRHGSTDNSVRYSAGADIRLATNLWLSFSVGSEGGNKEGDETSILGGLKYAIGDRPTIAVGN